MITRIGRYLKTTVTPLDYLISPRKKRGQVHLGWCSVFPPTQNGAAMLSHTVLTRLVQEPGLFISAIPHGRRIEKNLFPQLGYTTVADPSLDAVIFFCLGPSSASYLSRSRAKRTLVWQTAHESIESDEREAALFEIIRSADCILTMSRGACTEYRSHGADNVGYLPAGVDTDLFAPRPYEGRLRVLCATRIHYYKGISAYLDAIELVCAKRPEVTFCLHGPIDMNTNYYTEITGKIENALRRFPDNFTYQGQWLPAQAVPDIFRKADVFVFPSDNEGFGVPLIEAMSCGMPCIVLDKAPMNEIVQEGITGYCLPIGRGHTDRYHGYRFPAPEDIAAKILTLAADRDVYSRMSRAARSRILDEYSLNRCVQELMKHISAPGNREETLCGC